MRLLKRRSISELAHEVLKFGQSEGAQLERYYEGDTRSGRATKAYRKLARSLARRAIAAEQSALCATEVNKHLIARIQRLEDEIDRLDPTPSNGSEVSFASMRERDSIARYFEHLARMEMGTLIDSLRPRDVIEYAASWVRNRLDEKWAREVAANAPLPPRAT